MERENNERVSGTLEEVERLFYMSNEYLTKFEISLPVKTTTLRDVLPKLIFFFATMEGMKEKMDRGCTYSAPSVPSAFRGAWYNPETEKIDDEEVIWICACCNIKYTSLEPEDIIKIIKGMIEKGGQEKKAWVTYSSVAAVQHP